MRYLVILFCLIPFMAMAEVKYLEDEPNIKYGKLKENQTWRDDIYLVGDVIVPKGITLTIEPGTRIFFAEYDILQSGNDTEQTEILVDGELQANSSEENPILVSTIGDPQWKKISEGDNSVQIEFKPYLIDTKAMREEFHQFKKQYIVLWTLIYAMWILAL